MSDIFISYASEDRAKAQTLAQFLQNEGWETFWDRTIPLGLTWDQFIGKELTEARCVVVLWSQTSINSEFVREEAEEGKTRGILIPIRVEEVPLPFGFRRIQTGDIWNWHGTQDPEFKWVASNVVRLIGKPPRKAEEEQRRRAEEQARHKAQEGKQAEEEAKREADAAVKRKAQGEKAEASAEGMAQHKVAVKREERAAKLGKRAVIWGFPIGSILLSAGFGLPFGTQDWNWVSAEEVSHDASYATGFLLAFVIVLGTAVVLAYQRRGTLTGAEISAYWLGCTLALIPASGFLFAAYEWDWVGGDGFNVYDRGLATGLLLAFVIALGTAVGLAYRRRETLSGAEIGIYWLGCSVALITALGYVFAANEWNWVGDPHARDGGGQTGSLLAIVIAVGSGLAMVLWRRSIRTDSSHPTNDLSGPR
jgi:hypothetical protein